MMRQRYLTVIGVLVISTSVAAQSDLVARSQQQLIHHLVSQRSQHQVETEQLRTAIQSGQALEFARSPQQLLLEREQLGRAQQRLLEQVRAAPATTLPERLATLRLSCRQGRCDDALPMAFVEDALVAYGALALPSLQARWAGLDAADQEAVVYLSGRFTPAICPLAWLDQALAQQEYRVRAAALRVIQNNCAPAAFWARLDQQLNRETDPALQLSLLDFVPSDAQQSAAYRLHLLKLVQTERIALSAAFGKLCALPAPRLTLEPNAIDAEFWLRAFAQNPERQMCLVEALVLQLRDSATLEAMLPIFSAAAAHQYGFNDVTGLSRSAGMAEAAPWNSAPGNSASVLEVFRTGLSAAAIKRWRQDRALTLGDQMVLFGWQGGDPAQLLGSLATLEIVVTAAAGNTVSTLQSPITLGSRFDVAAPMRLPELAQVRYQGSVRFNSATLRFVLTELRIGLRPAAVSFAAEVPLSGAFATTLIVAGQPYHWRLRVLGHSPPS